RGPKLCENQQGQQKLPPRRHERGRQRCDGTFVPMIPNTIVLAGIEIQLEKQDTVIAFHSRTCGFCRTVLRSLDQVAPLYPALFVKIDAEEQKELAKSFHVKGVPIVLLIRHGLVLASLAGSINLTEMRAFLDPYFQELK
ncbi:MAG: thioredoxin family protein, partial [Candidatus Izemoplasmatales bacterium]|nr:thioredoxin family protein [Candidatus Izemoplasmatales bacterium]